MLLKPAITSEFDETKPHPFDELCRHMDAEDQAIEYMLGRTNSLDSETNKGFLKGLYLSLRKLALIEKMVVEILHNEDLYELTSSCYGDNYYEAIKKDALRLRNITLNNMYLCSIETPKCEYNDKAARFKALKRYYSSQIDNLFKICYNNYICLCESAGIEIKEFDGTNN